MSFVCGKQVRLKTKSQNKKWDLDSFGFVYKVHILIKWDPNKIPHNKEASKKKISGVKEGKLFLDTAIVISSK